LPNINFAGFSFLGEL